MQEGREEERQSSPLREAARYGHFGAQMALATGLFLYVGWWLDGVLGWTPILTIVGALGGAAAGFANMYVHLVVEPRRRGEAEQADETESRD